MSQSSPRAEMRDDSGDNAATAAERIHGRERMFGWFDAAPVADVVATLDDDDTVATIESMPGPAAVTARFQPGDQAAIEAAVSFLDLAGLGELAG